MKTQCPHCQAKFKAPDESTGKKVNCPKCNQQFVISPLIKDKIVEVCSNCCKEIEKLEQACVFKGEIVCAECDKKLRNTVDRRDNQDNAKKDIGDQLAKSEQGMSPKRNLGNIKVLCPSCGRSLRGATKEMVGDVGICPKCKTEFEIVDSKAHVSQEDTEPQPTTKLALIDMDGFRELCGWYWYDNRGCLDVV